MQIQFIDHTTIEKDSVIFARGMSKPLTFIAKNSIYGIQFNPKAYLEINKYCTPSQRLFDETNTDRGCLNFIDIDYMDYSSLYDMDGFDPDDIAESDDYINDEIDQIKLCSCKQMSSILQFSIPEMYMVNFEIEKIGNQHLEYRGI